jgi:apolipoprotein N-acyltransferase
VSPASKKVKHARTDKRPLMALCWWCVLSGCLVFTSFPFLAEPASNFWPLAFVGLVPFLYVLEDVTPKRGFWLGWLAGFVTNIGGFWWVSHVIENFGGMPPAAAWGIAGLNAAYQGLQIAIFGWLFARLRPPSGERHSIFRVAMLYTAVEFVFPMIFPWFYANSQYRFLPMIQLADITGVMGVTFVMVLFNCSVYETIRGKWLKKAVDKRRIVIGYGATVATILYGLVRLAQVEADMEDAEKLRVGLVEANVGILNEEQKAHPGVSRAKLMHSHLLRHQRLSATLEKEGVDLIVWPESSYLPTGGMHIKREPNFAIGVTESGHLAAWRDLAPSPFGWSLLEKISEAPLRAVSAAREDLYAAVGDEGTIFLHEDGVTQKVETSSRKALLAVSLGRLTKRGANRVGAPVALWAAGEGGTLLQPQFKTTGENGLYLTADNRRLDRRMPHGSPWTEETFRALAMVDALNGWAAGDKGTLVQIKAGHVFLVPAAVQADFHGIYIGSAGYSGVRLVGSQGGIWRVSPVGGLQQESTPTDQTLRAIHGNGELLYAVGDGGVVLRLGADRTWSKVGENLPEDLTALAVDPTGTLIVAGGDGGLWSRESGSWKAHDPSGMGRVTGMAPLGYVGVLPMPREAKYVRQSGAPVPHEDAFLKKASIESGLVRGHDKNAVQRGFTTPILYGGITWEYERTEDGGAREAKYNTAVLLDELGRVVDTYDKNYLLMFGEYIPMGESFPELYNIFPSGRFEAGTDVKVFDFKGFRLGVMVCYEDILPKFTRRLADKDPHVIINVTNDAWFGKNSEPYLHLALATFRSIENRVALVRSTNTGVSAIVAPTGELVQQTSLDGYETLIADLPMMEGGTVYGRIGDAFAYLMLLWLGMVVLRQFQGTRAPKSGNHRG